MVVLKNTNKFFECEIPFLPPSVNKVINAARYGQKDRSVKDDQTAMVFIMRRACRIKEPYAGNIALKYTLYTPNNRCFDIDNRVKTMQDCLAWAGIIKDDKQIIFMQEERCRTKSNERCKVELYRYKMRTVD